MPDNDNDYYFYTQRNDLIYSNNLIKNIVLYNKPLNRREIYDEFLSNYQILDNEQLLLSAKMN